MDAMNFSINMRLFAKCTIAVAMVVGSALTVNAQEPSSQKAAAKDTGKNAASQSEVQLCQGYETVGCNGSCGGGCNGAWGSPVAYAHNGRMLTGVDQNVNSRGREASWRNAQPIPWEALSYGEYLGPHRTPHVAEYRLRVNDSLEFVYLLTREKTAEPYQLYVGDVIQVTSAIDESLNQAEVGILPDGSISLSLIGQVRAAGKTVGDLQRELNDRYMKYVKNPSIVIQVTAGETPLQDLRDSVDARAGQGGQARAATVSPDGTVQLPMIGSVPAVGLTLNEIGREVNARYRMKLRGIEVTPILIQRAPRFIYVVGEVNRAGRFELVGPTTAIQAVALAEGFSQGGNLRQVVVLRRDQDWRLTATKLDLAGALYGKRPRPSDEIWLRDSDIVLIPKKPIQRLSEAVNLYLTNTLYGVFPAELGSFDAGAVIQ
jgi:polysaccharide export outer membrane protein